MILGAQGYTVRAFMQNERDIHRTLQKVAAIGYRTIQISGIGPIDPQRLRALCDESGLQIVLTHTPEARILNDIDAVIREHDILGCDYIGLGSMPERYRQGGEAWVRFFGEDFLTPAKKMRDAGKLFMYHNHNFEFERMPGGQTLMELILEMFPADLMGVTLDTYWLQAAGCDIVQWIQRLGDRIPCVHLKDMSVAGSEIRMAAVGDGNLNWPAILEAIQRNGKTKYMLVEQDTCYGESPFDCLKRSYEHVASLGYK